MTTDTTTGINWRGLTHIGGFGATVALAGRLSIPSTVYGFMPNTLGSFKGEYSHFWCTSLDL